MSTSIVEFADNGQDFLHWVVNAEGVVIDSRPFQADVWRGLKVTNLAQLKAGGVIEYRHHGRAGCISHLVRSVVPVVPTEVAVRANGIAGYVTSSVRGKKVSCTHSDEYAVQQLAKKLFPDRSSVIERVPFKADGRIHSKWRITPEGA